MSQDGHRGMDVLVCAWSSVGDFGYVFLLLCSIFVSSKWLYPQAPSVLSFLGQDQPMLEGPAPWQVSVGCANHPFFLQALVSRPHSVLPRPP